jgi:ADP-ribosylglycohydrolase
MLIELAIGDAYGAGFEYAPGAFVRQHNDLTGYRQHPRHNLHPGQYTDDTQMSIAIAEAIVADDPWTPEHLAARFVQAFQRDPRPGYAQRFYDFLLTVQDGHDFLQRINPASDKSGAAMRAAPIGIFPTIREVIARCQVQAALTHNTPDGINAAVAAALMSHYFLYDRGDKADLGRFLERHVPGDWAQPWQGKVGASGWMSVRAAVTALVQSRTLSELLQCCIAFRGDVDTVAAIALAAAACSAEITADLPQQLHRELEDGAYGYRYIQQLDMELLALGRKK